MLDCGAPKRVTEIVLTIADDCTPRSVRVYTTNEYVNEWNTKWRSAGRINIHSYQGIVISPLNPPLGAGIIGRWWRFYTGDNLGNARSTKIAEIILRGFE